jgi:hypothetical protein
MKMKVITLITAATLALSIQAADLLGSTHLARHHTDRDVIKLTPAKCGLTKIKLKVSKRKADVEEIAVQYAATGRWDMLSVRNNFRRGSSSRWIDLRGNKNRCIKKIAIVGDSDGLPLRRSKISVYGK